MKNVVVSVVFFVVCLVSFLFVLPVSADAAPPPPPAGMNIEPGEEYTMVQMVAEERERHLITLYRGLVKVEVFLPFLPLQQSILDRAVKRDLAGRSVPITTAEDLVVLKMAFHRDKDLRDVRSILWNQQGRLDLAYVRTWASRMLSNEHKEELEAWIRQYAL